MLSHAEPGQPRGSSPVITINYTHVTVNNSRSEYSQAASTVSQAAECIGLEWIVNNNNDQCESSHLLLSFLAPDKNACLQSVHSVECALVLVLVNEEKWNRKSILRKFSPVFMC